MISSREPTVMGDPRMSSTCTHSVARSAAGRAASLNSQAPTAETQMPKVLEGVADGSSATSLASLLAGSALRTVL